jgi:hypothetical protein
MAGKGGMEDSDKKVDFFQGPSRSAFQLPRLVVFLQSYHGEIE